MPRAIAISATRLTRIGRIALFRILPRRTPKADDSRWTFTDARAIVGHPVDEDQKNAFVRIFLRRPPTADDSRWTFADARAIVGHPVDEDQKNAFVPIFFRRPASPNGSTVWRSWSAKKDCPSRREVE